LKYIFLNRLQIFDEINVPFCLITCHFLYIELLFYQCKIGISGQKIKTNDFRRPLLKFTLLRESSAKTETNVWRCKVKITW